MHLGGGGGLIAWLYIYFLKVAISYLDMLEKAEFGQKVRSGTIAATTTISAVAAAATAAER